MKLDQMLKQNLNGNTRSIHSPLKTAKRCAFKGFFLAAGIALGAASVYTITKYGGEIKEKYDEYKEEQTYMQNASTDYRLENLLEVNSLTKQYHEKKK